MFDLDTKRKEIADAEQKMSAPGFWDRPQEARELVHRLKLLKHHVSRMQTLQTAHDDLGVLLELASEDEAGASGEAAEMAARFLKDLEAFELTTLLDGEHDANNAVIAIHPGAGGTESQDWAEMLLRMYLRWVEENGFKASILDYQPGEEAGIKDATVEIEGEYAYGYLQSENGIHRCVRISPYDAAKRRHTSFASVFVLPQVEEAADVEIRDEDLRVDTFRASGAGGQHVNKTESAVRITHVPTGIVVGSQAERSQHRNREFAMKILRAKLWAHLREEEEKKLGHITGNKKDIAWGNQIRSYVFQPYTMVKDHRTSQETGDIQAVMDGDLNPFIDAFLRSPKRERAAH
ncbi:MAG: peptide chain release factor 2 [Candidatus Eisenbacteria bacterium]|uniref:Peptide chain release factor 2 n=1 Tax=Eiseniibacteriota bacterium TaxID=2212470 RepID=A0A956LZV9_UNCEI|nr:peptide chain release factor 2 [Candidatus Eisenbacteria bacterium]